MRDKIKLVSSAGTGHYYTTDKNKRTTPDKMEVKKELKEDSKLFTSTERLSKQLSKGK